MNTIGDRIKTKRKELGLTQVELGEKLHVTDRAVSKWEQNDGNPDFSLLPQLAEILGVTLDYLITGKVVEPLINLDDMDATKRAIYLAKRDDVVNFKKYGYVSGTVLLSPSFRERMRREYRLKTPQYEDEICKIVLEEKKEKIFKKLLKAFLDTPDHLPYHLNHISPNTILGEGFNDFIILSAKTGCISGLEFVDFKYLLLPEKMWAAFSAQQMPDSFIEYICDCEFFKANSKSDGETEYKVCQIHDAVLALLYNTQRFDKIKSVLTSLYKNLEQTIPKYTPQINDSYRQISFNGSCVCEHIRWPSGGAPSYHILGYIPRISHALQSAINNYDFEWIEKFNDYNKAISKSFYNGIGGFLTGEDLQALKIHQENAVSKIELIGIDHTRLSLLSYCSVPLCETSDVEKADAEKTVGALKKHLEKAQDIYLSVIRDGFIHYMELVEVLLAAKNYRKLFEFACNYDLKQLSDVVLERNDREILKVAKSLFLPPEPYNSQFANLREKQRGCNTKNWREISEINSQINHVKKEYFSWIQKNKPDIYPLIVRQSSIIPIQEYCCVSDSFANYCKKLKYNYYISFVNNTQERIEAITHDKELNDEYQSVIQSITEEYLTELLQKDETELFVIKLCARMDVTLKYQRYDGEDFFTRMDAFFKKNVPASRDCDDGWGYTVLDTAFEEKEVKPWQRRQELFNRLRMQRNNIAHSDNNNVEPLTQDELQECMKFVLSM